MPGAGDAGNGKLFINRQVSVKQKLYKLQRSAYSIEPNKINAHLKIMHTSAIAKTIGLTSSVVTVIQKRRQRNRPGLRSLSACVGLNPGSHFSAGALDKTRISLLVSFRCLGVIIILAFRALEKVKGLVFHEALSTVTSMDQALMKATYHYFC